MKHNKGSVVCVGLGMVLGAHIPPLSRQFIENADIVFMSVTNILAEQWIQSMNVNTISLQQFYQEGKDRRIGYQQMVDAMLEQVRMGKKVVGAFYGHPGVFAWAPHQVIKQAKDEGFHGHMEPGISAEDSLYADLAIDPGKSGIAHYEASQYLLYKKRPDKTAYLILWQIGFFGDLSMSQFQTGNEHLELLSNELSEQYSGTHEVAVYEAATLPTENFSVQWIPIDDLTKASVQHHSTLVIPPIMQPELDEKMLKRMKEFEQNSN